jgi:hypothetical protein
MIAEKKAPMVAREATFIGALKDDGIPVRHETMVVWFYHKRAPSINS